MIVGFNHNILYLGVGFHVQTEDGGLKSPSLVTLLYHGGIIVSSQKTSYADILGVDNLNQVVEDLAKEQHKGMLRRLTNGEFDARIREFGIEIEGDQSAPENEPETTAAEKEPVSAEEIESAVEPDVMVESEEAEVAVSVDATVEEEPLLGEEIEQLEAVPLELPVVAVEEPQQEASEVVSEPEVQSDVDLRLDDHPVAIEPAFEPQSAEDRDQRQDVSEALDDLIFSYLTGGDEKS